MSTGSDCLAVSDHAHICAKWEFCEKQMKMFNILWEFELEASKFVLYSRYDRKKDDEDPRYLISLNTIQELEAYILGWIEGRGV